MNDTISIITTSQSRLNSAIFTASLFIDTLKFSYINGDATIKSIEDVLVNHVIDDGVATISSESLVSAVPVLSLILTMAEVSHTFYSRTGDDYVLNVVINGLTINEGGVDKDRTALAKQLAIPAGQGINKYRHTDAQTFNWDKYTFKKLITNMIRLSAGPDSITPTRVLMNLMNDEAKMPSIDSKLDTSLGAPDITANLIEGLSTDAGRYWASKTLLNIEALTDQLELPANRSIANYTKALLEGMSARIAHHLDESDRLARIDNISEQWANYKALASAEWDNYELDSEVIGLGHWSEGGDGYIIRPFYTEINGRKVSNTFGVQFIASEITHSYATNTLGETVGEYRMMVLKG